jgi:hypothetical protein
LFDSMDTEAQNKVLGIMELLAQRAS